jgi:hypothetical protein
MVMVVHGSRCQDKYNAGGSSVSSAAPLMHGVANTANAPTTAEHICLRNAIMTRSFFPCAGCVKQNGSLGKFYGGETKSNRAAESGAANGVCEIARCVTQQNPPFRTRVNQVI